MIDSKILNSLTSKENDISYALLITGYEQAETCNSESIKIKMHQIDKKISAIEAGTNPVEKTLTIQSALDFDEELGLFTTKLIGNSNIKGRVNAIAEGNTYNSHSMEMVNAELDDSIEIEFIEPFTHIPSINMTMDTKTRNLFYNYNYDFESHKDENNKYAGVTINFTKLRRKTNYPEINILIIGDKNANSGGN